MSYLSVKLPFLASLLELGPPLFLNYLILLSIFIYLVIFSNLFLNSYLNIYLSLTIIFISFLILSPPLENASILYSYKLFTSIVNFDFPNVFIIYSNYRGFLIITKYNILSFYYVICGSKSSK